MSPRDQGEPKEGQKDLSKNKKRKSKKMIAVIVMMVLLSGAGIWYWQVYGQDPLGMERSDPLEVSSPMEFTVNLADSGQRRYLKATVSLAYEASGLETELISRQSELRDLMIGLFRARTVSEISCEEGTDTLRREIKEVVNDRLQTGKVIQVFFTEFIIQ